MGSLGSLGKYDLFSQALQSVWDRLYWEDSVWPSTSHYFLVRRVRSKEWKFIFFIQKSFIQEKNTSKNTYPAFCKFALCHFVFTQDLDQYKKKNREGKKLQREQCYKRSQDYHSKGISNSDSVTSYLANLCFFLCFLTVLRNFQPPPPPYVKPLCILNTQ